jgi:penicillin-binding protein 1A
MLGLFRKIFTIFVFCVTAATSVSFFVFFYYGRGLPDYQFLKDYQPHLASRLYANDYQVIKEYAFEKRIFKPLNQIPVRLIQAFISAEDKNFYYHFGLDFRGLIRAVLTNMLKKSLRGRPLGASTITQQVAKNFLVGNEQSFQRKIKEAVISIRLELSLSKQRILELYLNQVYLGRGSYGVVAAAQAYFGKNLDDLSLEECAFLAALPKAPALYDRKSEVKKAQGRRDWVIKRLQEDGHITLTECQATQSKPLGVSKNLPKYVNANYFSEEVKRDLYVHLKGQDITKAGLNIFTTLDPDLQNISHTSLREGLVSFNNDTTASDITGAIVVMEAETGHVLALCGGVDYDQSQFNCATQAKRQPGSLFKPIAYLAALEKGYTPETIINDNPIKISLGQGQGFYKPKNYSRKYHGPSPLRTGVEQSRNVMTIKLVQQIGMDAIQEMAARLGINERLPNHLAMALGAGETTLLRLTTAYSIIINGGKKVKPVFLHKVENYLGLTVYESGELSPEIVIDSSYAEAMTDMLRGAVQRGTARRLKYLTETYPIDLGGKTGTTNDCYDAWFIGFIKRPNEPTLVVGIFVGFLKPKSLGLNATGARLALPIFENLVKKYIDFYSIKPASL